MWTLPDPKSPVSIADQIARQVRAAVSSGRLVEGARLPSVRTLAAELLVNPNTVQKAFRELEVAGLVDTRPGSGVTVSIGARWRAAVAARDDFLSRILGLVCEMRAAGYSGEALEELVREALRVAPMEVVS